MRRRVSLALLGSAVTALGVAQIATSAGCNDIGNVTPVGAADAPAISCATDPPPVMQYLDPNGMLQNGDWSCYAQPDGGFFRALDTDGGDGGDDGGEAGPTDADVDSALDADVDSGADAGADASGPLPDAGGDGAVPTARFHLIDFITMGSVGGATIDILYGNDATKPADFTGKTSPVDAGSNAGAFFFPTGPSDALWAFRVNGALSDPTGSASLVDLVWFDNIPVAPNAAFEGQTLTQGEEQFLSSGIGVQTQPGTMLLTLAVRDCQYRDVQGGIVELVDDATGIVVTSGVAASDIHVAYFNVDHFPDNRCTHTVAAPSLWAAVNVPSNRSYTVRARGRMMDSDATPRILGERHVPAIPDTIVIVRPYRLNKP